MTESPGIFEPAHIGKMNCFLHGIEDFRIERDDTLANPPCSIKQWDRSAWATYPFERNIYGTPSQGRADYAFWKHIFKRMNTSSGRCTILFPHGILFRNEESVMREKLIAHDVNAHIERIDEACQIFSDEDGFSHVARNDEIRKRESNLSIPLYIRTTNIQQMTLSEAPDTYAHETLNHAATAWQESSMALRKSMDSLFGIFESNNWSGR